MADSPRDNSLKTRFDPGAFLSNPGVGIAVERFQKNQEVFVQGEAADTVCYLQKGQVKATVLSDRGKEAIVGIFQEGQFFGEGCLDDGAKFRTTTTIALEQCDYLCQKGYDAFDPQHGASLFGVFHGPSYIAE